MVTVTARVNSQFAGTAKNVAYVSPASTDGPETNPLVIPTLTTDTSLTDTDNDAQAIISAASLVSVGDYVWWDVNRDGQQNESTPVSGVTVRIYDGVPAAGQAPLRETTTSASGFYSFTDLTPGASYTIEFVKPAGTSFTSRNVGADLTDSDAALDTGRVLIAAPASGNNSATSPDDPTWDAGLVKLNLSLTKTETSTGPYYLGSTPQTSSLVTWTLTPHNDGPVNALAGWSVTEVMPSGLTLVSMTGAGYTPKVGDPNTLVADAALAANANGPVITVTARISGLPPAGGELRNVAYVAPVAGETPETNPLVVPPVGTDHTKTSTDNDASDPVEVASRVSIGDYVWFDTNRNGLQDENTPISGVKVTLYAADGTTVVATTTTDTTGYYAFADLTPGVTYVVGFTKPANTVFTTSNVTVNPNDAKDSDPDPATGKVTVVAPASGQNRTAAGQADDPTIDAGFVKLVSMGDFVWFDRNRNGLFDAGEPVVPGVTVNLFSGTTKIATTTTNPQGFYSFNNLLAGAPYEVEFVRPTGTEFTEQNAKASSIPQPGSDSDADPATGIAQFVAPPSGLNLLDAPDDPTVDAGLFELVSIGDYVWMDVDRDGIQDAGEPVVPGVTVRLLDGTTVVATTITDPSGRYAFTGLPGGTAYTVEFVKPAGTSFTVANTPSDDAADSDPDPATGLVKVTTPVTGNNVAATPDDPTIDAGLVRFNLTLAKKLTSVAPFVPGQNVTYTLTPHNDGPAAALAGWSVTDALPTGLEFVSLTGTGYTCTGQTCTAGAPLGAAQDGPVLTMTAKITTGFTGTAKNVAWVAPVGTDVPETNVLVIPTLTTDTLASVTDNDSEATLTVPKVSIGDHVWWDTNRDGVQGSDETPVGGVTVNLYSGTTKVGTTTTTTAGFYSFADLVPGATYTVEFLKPYGTSFTTTNAGTDDARDSDADATTGRVTVVAPTSGGNSLTTPDDPTIDAGLTKNPVFHLEKQAHHCDTNVTVCALTGAAFAVYASDPTPGGVQPLAGGITVDPTNGALFTSAPLPLGEYWIVETRAPQGFSLLPAPIHVRLTASAVELVTADPLVIAKAGDPLTLVVSDVAKPSLPLTGGPGPWPYLGGGLLLLVLAGFALRFGTGATPRRATR